jgi:hypothetical protein
MPTLKKLTLLLYNKSDHSVILLIACKLFCSGLLKCRQCTITQHYGVFMQPLLLWERNYYIFRVCVCSLRYPARKAHAPYCHLWPVRLYNICPHYLTNSNIFEKKKFQNLKCVSLFFANFVWTISHSYKNWARWAKMYIGLHVTYSSFMSDFNET